MPNAAIYTCVSRDELGDGLAVTRQREDCTKLCERRGWASPRVYVDDDISAYSGRLRPAYRILLTDIDAGRVDVVIAWAPERLHWSPPRA